MLYRSRSNDVSMRDTFAPFKNLLHIQNYKLSQNDGAICDLFTVNFHIISATKFFSDGSLIRSRMSFFFFFGGREDAPGEVRKNRTSAASCRSSRWNLPPVVARATTARYIHFFLFLCSRRNSIVLAPCPMRDKLCILAGENKKRRVCSLQLKVN